MLISTYKPLHLWNYFTFKTLRKIKQKLPLPLLQNFDHILPNTIFAEVLNTFYNSERDELTIRILLTS